MRINASRKLFAAVTAVGLISAAVSVGAAEASGASGWTRGRVVTPKAHGASAWSSYGVDIQAVYDKAGNPSLVANFRPDGGLARPRWSICSPSDPDLCTPTNRATPFLDAGPTPAGTVFQATATYKGQTYGARSASWLGTVRATVAPWLGGHARYRTTVAPHGAGWTGGWETDSTVKPQAGSHSGGRGPNFDFLSVEACRTPEARHCVNLSAPRGYGFSQRPPVVGAWFTGWYLFAFDQRLAHDTSFAEPGYGTPAAVPPVKVSGTVARSAPLGPVIGPPAPRVSIRHDAILRDGRVLVARIRCSVRCQVFLQVDDNHTGSAAHLTLAGSGLVGVPRKQLRPRLLNVQISLDAGPLMRGKTQLRDYVLTPPAAAFRTTAATAPSVMPHRDVQGLTHPGADAFVGKISASVRVARGKRTASRAVKSTSPP